MAHYLIVDKTGEIPIVTETEGANIPRAIEAAKLKPGQTVTIYRIAAPGRKLSVRERTDIELVFE